MTAQSSAKEAAIVSAVISTETHEDPRGTVRITVHAPSWFSQNAARTLALAGLTGFRAAQGVRGGGAIADLPTAGHPDGRRSYHFVETD